MVGTRRPRPASRPSTKRWDEGRAEFSRLGRGSRSGGEQKLHSCRPPRGLRAQGGPGLDRADELIRGRPGATRRAPPALARDPDRRCSLPSAEAALATAPTALGGGAGQEEARAKPPGRWPSCSTSPSLRTSSTPGGAPTCNQVAAYLKRASRIRYREDDLARSHRISQLQERRSQDLARSVDQARHEELPQEWPIPLPGRRTRNQEGTKRRGQPVSGIDRILKSPCSWHRVRATPSASN